MKDTFKKIITLTIIVTITLLNFYLFNVKSTLAAFNQEINYQGRLLDDLGDPVVDANYSMEFKLYTVATGGTDIWNETQATVGTKDGLFSVMVGDVTSLSSVDFNQTLYLGINIEGDGEMSPRKVLGAVPAAFEARKLNGITSDQFFRNDIVNATNSATTSFSLVQNGAGKIMELFSSAMTSVFSVLSNGNVGIGTTTPTQKLSVEGSGLFTGTLTASNFSGSSSGTNTGDVTLAGQDYLSIAGQVITANQVNLASNVTGTLPVLNGGTGQTTFTNGQLLIGNTTGGTLSKANLTGTSNQVIVTNGAGSITLSLPQAIGTTGTPQFARIGLGAAANASIPLSATRNTAGVTQIANFINSAAAANNNGSQITFTTNRTTGGATVVAGIQGLITDITNTAYKGALAFSTADNAAPVERMRITNEGNVGIGTSNPQTKLDISGTASTTDLLVANKIAIGLASTKNPILDIVTGTGTGTTNESVGVRLRGSATDGNSLTMMLGAGSVGNNNTYIQSSYWGGTQYTSHLDLNPNGGRVRINNLASLTESSLEVGGNILVQGPSVTNAQMGKIGFNARGYGISGQTPAYIAGFADNGIWSSGIGLTFNTISGADVNGSNGLERMRITSAGNVGIGTTTPSAKLSVAGSALIDGYVTSSYFTATSTTATSTLPNFQTTNAKISGKLYDGSSSAGTNGYVLQTTGTGIQWVATSTLGISGGGGGGGMAIGSAVTSGTSGSVLYVDGSGNLAQDNSGFYYDPTTNYLNVGTSTDALVIGDITGNTRGADSVDIQSKRSSNSEVASGAGSVAVGISNTASGANSTVVGVSNTSTSGDGSTAVGYFNTTSGYYSAAVGTSNTTSGTYTSAFGYGNSASASMDISSAFGYSNTSSGDNSSAFGTSNTASGYLSSAFGFGNISSSDRTSAIGFKAEATASGASTFGGGGDNYSSLVNNTANSTLIGPRQSASIHILDTGEVKLPFITATSTTATSTLPNLNTTNAKISGKLYDGSASAGINGYVLQTTGTGIQWVATSTLGISGGGGGGGMAIGSAVSSGTSGSVLFVDGSGNLAQDNDGFYYDPTTNYLNLGTSTDALVIGDITGNTRGADAVDIQSVRLSASAVASGYMSIGIGSSNVSSGLSSVAIGTYNYSSNTGSLAIGRSNSSANIGSSAVGYINSAYGVNSSAVGYENTVSSDYSSAFGYMNSVGVSTYGLAIGATNTLRGNYSSAVGNLNIVTASGEGNSVFGYKNNISDPAVGSTVVGNSNDNYAAYSNIFGYNNNIGSGADTSLALGTSNSISTNAYNSVSIGNLNSVIASYGLSLGYLNAAYSSYSVVVGTTNVASGNYSNAIGSSNTASGLYSNTIGYKNTASGLYSNAFGYRTLATATGASVFGGGGNGLLVDMTNSVANSTLIGPGATTSIHILGTGEVKLPYLTATSTNATSTFAGGLVVNTSTLVVDYSGNKVGIGTTAPARKLHVYTSVDEAPVRFQDANGYCEINPTSTTWTCTSDRRLKDNISNVENTTPDLYEKMRLLRPVTFEWKTDSTNTTRVGFIAQEVEAIFPDFVTTDSDTGMKAVSYGSFIPYIVYIIQELADKVDYLTQRIEAMTASGMSSIGGVISKLTIGSSEKPTGVTLFDEVTGEPFCLSVKNGAMVTKFGECVAGENTGGGNGSSNTPPVVPDIEDDNDQDIVFDEEPEVPNTDAGSDESVEEVVVDEPEVPAETETPTEPVEEPEVPAGPVAPSEPQTPPGPTTVVETNSSSGSAGLSI